LLAGAVAPHTGKIINNGNERREYLNGVSYYVFR